MLPLQDPVATPHGIIFSREAILENLLAQKKTIRRKLAAWEAQQAGETRKVRCCYDACQTPLSCL